MADYWSDRRTQRRHMTPERRAAQRKAAQARQRQFERRVLQVSLGMCILLIIVAIWQFGTNVKLRRNISTQAEQITQLETDQKILAAQLEDAQEEIAEAQAAGQTSSSGAQAVSGTEVTLTGPVESSFFDDALFVGDSVSYKMELYAQSVRGGGGDCLGAAQFFTAGSLSWGNLQWDLDSTAAVFPSYQGVKMYLEDAVVASGAAKVYIMLGINDVALYGVDGTIENIGEVCRRILEKSPNVQIFIESVTPIQVDCQGGQLNNEVVAQLNTAIKRYCEEAGFYYVDIYSVVSTADGALMDEYCSDPGGMGIHFTDAGCQVWVDYLLAHPYGI